MDAVLALGELALRHFLCLLLLLLPLLGNGSGDDGLLEVGLEVLHLGIVEDLVRHDVLPQLAQLLVGRPERRVDLQCLQEVLLGVGVPGLLFADDAEQVQPVAAVGHRVVVLGLGLQFAAEEGALRVLVFVDLAAAEGKFVPVHLAAGLLEDVVDLVVLVLRHVAVGQQAAHLLGVLLGEQAFGEEGGVGGDLVLEGVVDGLDELRLQEGVVLRLLFDHLNCG